MSTHESFRVDFSVFKKTKDEKAYAYTVKKEWERTMKLFFGKNWRKFNNFPEKLTN